jgi:DNA-binding PucR family transcriptional regulator
MRQFDRLLDEMLARVDSLAELTLERLRERSPDWSIETAFSREQILTVARSSILTQLRAFGRDELPSTCPEADAAAARAVARVGELRIFSSAYRAAQLVLWDTWFSLVEDAAESGADERRRLLARGSDFFFRYADLLEDQIAAVYREERSRLHDTNGRRRFRAVKALLDGQPSTALSLDLDLDQHHLGLLAWDEHGEEAARLLAGRLGRPLFLLAPIEHTWWGWISGQKPFDVAEQRSVELFEPPPGAGLAIGLQEFGAPGFRATHRQAQRARMLAPAGSPTLVRYADVAVEALASENEQEARSFVDRELGAIGDDSAPSARIRDTLSAYFAAGHNASSAAATLGVHEQTVANRLRTAEERLGHPIGARRVELEVALRLRASLARERSES